MNKELLAVKRSYENRLRLKQFCIPTHFFSCLRLILAKSSLKIKLGDLEIKQC